MLMYNNVIVMENVMQTWEEMTEHEQLECMLWDAYKDAHGIRPRFMNMQEMSLEELKKELEYCCRTIEQNEIQRKADEEVAMHDFEMRVQNLMVSGAKSREQALRWVHEAEGSDGDDEYLCYLLGLPYGYFRKAA
jgi:hypothetical protein